MFRKNFYLLVNSASDVIEGLQINSQKIKNSPKYDYLSGGQQREKENSSSKNKLISLIYFYIFPSMIHLNFPISSKTTFKRIYIYNIFLYHMSAITRKINSKNKGGVRPKKCHNCQKLIASNKYNEHFEACYRFKEGQGIQSKESAKKKLSVQHHKKAEQNPRKPLKYSFKVSNQEGREKSIKKASGIRPPSKSKIRNRKYIVNQIKQSLIQEDRTKRRGEKSQNHEFIQEPIVQIESQRKEIDSDDRNLMRPNSGFRIKNTAHVRKNEHIISINQNPEMPNSPKIQTSQSLLILDKEKVQQSLNANITFEQEKKVEREQQLQRQRQLHQEQQQQRQRQRRREIAIAEQQERQLLRERERRREEQRRGVHPSEEESAEQNEAPDLSSLIMNTNQIIEFIESMPNIPDETLTVMMGQLRQLNMIAVQVGELHGLGQNLGLQMAPLFANRIRELQTTIINQIGVAIMRGFSNRLNSQFQNLINQRPDFNLALALGLTEEQIEQKFPEKLSLRQSECSICLEDIGKYTRVRQLQCEHIFHPACIGQWLRESKKCPVCRAVQKLN